MRGAGFIFWVAVAWFSALLRDVVLLSLYPGQFAAAFFLAFTAINWVALFPAEYFAVSIARRSSVGVLVTRAQIAVVSAVVALLVVFVLLGRDYGGVDLLLYGLSSVCCVIAAAYSAHANFGGRYQFSRVVAVFQSFFMTVSLLVVHFAGGGASYVAVSFALACAGMLGYCLFAQGYGPFLNERASAPVRSFVASWSALGLGMLTAGSPMASFLSGSMPFFDSIRGSQADPVLGRVVFYLSTAFGLFLPILVNSAIRSVSVLRCWLLMAALVLVCAGVAFGVSLVRGDLGIVYALGLVSFVVGALSLVRLLGIGSPGRFSFLISPLFFLSVAFQVSLVVPAVLGLVMVVKIMLLSGCVLGLALVLLLFCADLDCMKSRGAGVANV